MKAFLWLFSLFLLGVAGLLAVIFSDSSPPVTRPALKTNVPVPQLVSTPLPVGETSALSPKIAADGLKTSFGRFQTGDYEGSIALLRTEFKNDPRSTLVRENLATALFALGLVRIQQQRLPEAEALLEEAIGLGHAEARLVLGKLNIKSGKWDSAKALFEEGLSLSKDPVTLSALVDIALKEGDAPQAEMLLGRLGRMTDSLEAADKADLKNFMDRRQARLEQVKSFSNSQEIFESTSVLVAFPNPAWKSAAEKIAQATESALSTLTPLLGTLPRNEKLKVWMVSQESFQGMTGAPPWAGAVFDGFVRLPVRGNAEISAGTLRQLLKNARHEATHAYFYAQCGDVLPAWLGEGFAQRIEGKSIQESAIIIKNLLGRNEKNVFESSPTLEGSFATRTSQDAGILYAKSYLLVTALSEQDPILWREFFKDICDDKLPPAQALATRFGKGTGDELWPSFKEQIQKLLR